MYADHYSLFQSSGTADSPIEIGWNRAQGGQNGSGSGVVLGDAGTNADPGGWQWAHDNQISMVWGAGMTIAGGHDQIASNNLIRQDGANQASMTYDPLLLKALHACSGVTVTGNRGIGRRWDYGGHRANVTVGADATELQFRADVQQQLAGQHGVAVAFHHRAARVPLGNPMAYATPTLIIQRFGLDEITGYLDDEQPLLTSQLLLDAIAGTWTGTPSDAEKAAATDALARLTRQLQVTSNTMDGYLRSAVTLPLSDDDANAGTLEDCCMALARCSLADDTDNATDRWTSAAPTGAPGCAMSPRARCSSSAPAATHRPRAASSRPASRERDQLGQLQQPRLHGRLARLPARLPGHHAMSGVGARSAAHGAARRRADAPHLARLVALDASHFKPVRREIGEYLLGEVQDNLDGQKLFDGSAMPQSKAAIARKGKTLIDKHHLYDSYAYQLTDDGVEIGSDSVYARIHHFGGETGRPGHRFTMTARPVLGVTEKQEKRIGDLLIAEIVRLQA